MFVATVHVLSAVHGRFVIRSMTRHKLDTATAIMHVTIVALSLKSGSSVVMLA